MAAASALAADPWLAGPSTVTPSEKGVFAGGNFTPGAIVTVTVADSLGNEYAQPVMIAADGKLTYELTPSVEGLYTLRITGADGKPLAKAAFGVGR